MIYFSYIRIHHYHVLTKCISLDMLAVDLLLAALLHDGTRPLRPAINVFETKLRLKFKYKISLDYIVNTFSVCEKDWTSSCSSHLNTLSVYLCHATGPLIYYTN